MAKKQEDIELRGEELQEVLGSIPSWILRWGITLDRCYSYNTSRWKCNIQISGSYNI